MREYELEVLEQYDIEVRSTRKIRGAFFCDTDQGGLLLKEVHFSEKRAPLLYQLCLQLKEEGFDLVDLPVLTKEGNCLSVYRDGTHYLLKHWFTGRECDVRKETEVLQCVRNLARLHRVMFWREDGLNIGEEPEWTKDGQRTEPKKRIESGESGEQNKGVLDERNEAGQNAQNEMDEKPADTGKKAGTALTLACSRDLKEDYLRHNRELRKVREYIRHKSRKEEFDLLYLKHFEEMSRLADLVMRRMETTEYDRLYRESLAGKCLVHGDYNYHNLLFVQGAIATTGFERFHIEIQMADFYYFFRKVMEKHGWKESLGIKMLEAYDAVRPLTKAEREYLAIRLLYPEKFWKIANSYYHSNKAWVPQKNTEKLKICVSQTEGKIALIEKIFSFHL